MGVGNCHCSLASSDASPRANFIILFVFSTTRIERRCFIAVLFQFVASLVLESTVFHLGPDGMRMELAPSMHGAILRVTFPPHTPNTEKRICFKLENDGWESLEKRGDGTAMIAGSSGRVNGHPSGFRHYIRAFSDEAVEKVIAKQC